MSEETCYQRNKDVIQNRTKECYKKNHKEILRYNASGKYRGFSEKKKREHGRNRCHMYEEKKQKI